MLFRFLTILAAMCVMFATQLLADDPVDYAKHIKPVLQARCYACHGVLKQKAGLRLDTAAFVVKGGDTGSAVDPQNVAASLLIERITATEESERMPPEGEPLSAEQIAHFKAWITQGAKGPADEQPERDPRDHWAFKAPVRPAVPRVADDVWNRNPIDAFIAAQHQAKGLQRQPPADKRVWLRRVYLDLIGLPPSLEELAAFAADESPQAYDNVVTRLLDSPQYGERWGRHWMDVWRYSDWWGLGAEPRNSHKHIWHWRDWIIESLNTDKGYDQMVREMLAADELYPNDLDKLRASGFLARQYFKFNRTSWMDETVEHTSKAFLGLTFNCAKCHDHKYDPIAQTDYYRLRAIFEPYQVRLDMLPGEADFERDGLARGFDCNLDAPTYLHIRGDDRNPDKSRVMEPAVPGFLSHAEWKIEPINLPQEAIQPGLRSYVADNYVKLAEQKITEARSALQTAKSKLAEADAAAAKIAAVPAEPKKPTQPVPPVIDDFATEKPDMWEPKDGKWSYTDGKLLQSLAGETRSALRLKSLPPENFEAKLKFKIGGGQTWKSVGITFDTVDPSDSVAYLSAYAGGPKSQVSFKKGNDYVYPPEAAQSRKVEVNQPYELTLRVRGTLVNLLIDNELSVAYRLPIARTRGPLQIITYDAQAGFTGFELKELPADFSLTEAKGGNTATEALSPVEQAQLTLRVAELTLTLAEAQPDTIKARAAAAQAQRQQPPPTEAANLAKQAAKLERTVARLTSELTAAQAELKDAKKPSDKKALQQTMLTAAKAKLEADLKAIINEVDKSVATFTPLGGSLKTVESNLETEDSRRKPYPQTSTGRRTALAKWITDPKHPLPARVAVNHMWMRHMGKPLVPTVFDFGRKGTPPTHPELLDWLAVEFIEHGWSMKHIHRLIVTSHAYRMSSSSLDAAPETLARDADNKFYWRANPVRMESQVIRDSLLSLAGELDPAMGGAPIPITDEASRRRSLYFVHTHNERQQFLELFDDASVLDCYRRSESIVPQQALALENSKLATEMGAKIVKRIEERARGGDKETGRQGEGGKGDDVQFAETAFIIILGTAPNLEELNTACKALARLTEIAKANNRPDAKGHARSVFVSALLNHNDFVTIR